MKGKRDEEGLPLLTEDQHGDSSTSSSDVSKFLSIAIFAGLGLVALGFTRNEFTYHPSLPSASELKILTTTDLWITTYNEYGQTESGAEYPWLKNKAIVEPHRYTTLLVNYDHTLGSKLSFAWKVTEPGASEPTSFSGQQITNTFTRTGSHKIAVTAYNADAVPIGVMATSAHCVYIKREIRTLTEEDRENFLDAALVMWKVGTKKGRDIYGTDYTGMDRFVSVHADQATGEIACDHWHEGSGFLTHHLALSLSFEMSLRAIDRRVTTPYWDFTIEGEKLLLAGVGPSKVAEISPIFTDLWFGSTDDLSHVKDSRWAHAPSQLATSEKHVQNSYGIIRAPWNNVRDRELVRHMSDVCGLEPVNKPVPTCSTHSKVMNLTTLPAFLVEIAGYGHGPMHVNTGGVYGACTGRMKKLYSDWEDEMNKVFTMKDIADAVAETTGEDPGWHSTTEFNMRMMIQKYIHLEYFHIYRMLWRSQTCALDGMSMALSCPDHCDQDTPEEECLCTCKGIDGDKNEDFDWENLEPCMYASDTAEKIFKAVIPTKLRKELITMMCSTGVKEGEQLESASPGDPLFWMIHPILDRMLTAKRLADTNIMTFGTYGRYKGFEDTSWLDYSYYTNDDTGVYCDGHGMYDAVLQDLPLPSHLIKVADKNDDNVLNNIEFYDAIDPQTGEGMDYIYDNFAWDHCNKNDESGENEWSTGYTDGVTSESGATDAEPRVATKPFTFSGGVNPGTWGGDTFKSLRPGNIKASDSIEQYRSEVEAYRIDGKTKPSKVLNARVGDTADQYNTVMKLLGDTDIKSQ